MSKDSGMIIVNDARELKDSQNAFRKWLIGYVAEKLAEEAVASWQDKNMQAVREVVEGRVSE